MRFGGYWKFQLGKVSLAIDYERDKEVQEDTRMVKEAIKGGKASF